MNFKIPSASKGTCVQQGGKLGTRISVTKRDPCHGGTETAQERVFEKDIPRAVPSPKTSGRGNVAQVKGITEGQARPTPYVGTSMGLTLPGPRNSYLVVRTEAWCSLPCSDDSDEAISATFQRCNELVQEQLAELAGTAQEFLDAAAG